MKKYLLVCWDRYYPAGGLGNIKGSFDSAEECEEFYKNLDDSHDCNYICDRDTLETVKEIRIRD